MTKRQTAARAACVEAVWQRAHACCERCGLPVVLYDGTNGWRSDVGHVDEIRPRSQGGSATDDTNCRLLCNACHFSGPSGAHRATPNWRPRGAAGKVWEP